MLALLLANKDLLLAALVGVLLADVVVAVAKVAAAKAVAVAGTVKAKVLAVIAAL